MGKGIVGPFKISVGYFAEHVHAKPSVTLLDECMTAECDDTHWAHVHPTSKICTYKTTNEYTNSRDYDDYF